MLGFHLGKARYDLDLRSRKELLPATTARTSLSNHPAVVWVTCELGVKFP